MYEENNSSHLNRLSTQESVKAKIAKIKQTQKLIKRLERLEVEIARLNKQLNTKKSKQKELIAELNLL